MTLLRVSWVAVCLMGFVHAQTPSATLVGRVVDTSGAVVPEASILLRNVNTNERHKAVTSANGEYTIADLVPGEYEAVVEKQGFRGVRQSSIELHISQQARLDAELQVGAVSEPITVTERAPLLNTENGAKGDVIVNREMLDMPLYGRDYNDLAFLVPGVAPRADGRAQICR